MRLVEWHGTRSDLVACTRCWPLLDNSRATVYLVTNPRRFLTRTWRTVTGTRTPLLSHMTVIPRFLAMSPVRIESADRLVSVELDASEFAACETLAAVLWSCLHCRRIRRGFDENVQGLSIVQV